ncbi:hypothetical protein BDZ97DRAFT_1846927 [Flammula alnicola]|nr:hypothetical protein BDZ97DRAFT_1846927 [Flammula alnicola]
MPGIGWDWIPYHIGRYASSPRISVFVFVFSVLWPSGVVEGIFGFWGGVMSFLFLFLSASLLFLLHLRCRDMASFAAVLRAVVALFFGFGS